MLFRSAIRSARVPELAAWRGIAAAVGAWVAIYGGIYALSAWPDMTWHIITSLPRLLIPVAMVALPLVVVAMPKPA